MMKKLIDRMDLWWRINQAPRARVVALSIHRALHPPDHSGSLGGFDPETLRTVDGGVFGVEPIAGAEMMLDAIYDQATPYGKNEPLQWKGESAPGLLARCAAHVVVLVDGTAGAVLSRTGWPWNTR